MLIGGAADFEAVLMIDAAAYDRARAVSTPPRRWVRHVPRPRAAARARLGPVLAVDEPLYLYRRHDGQASRDLAMLHANGTLRSPLA